MHHIINLLEHFGYFGIILALIGGIIGLPVPDEVLLTYVGFNVYQGKLSYLLSLLSAFTGAIGGISFSYLLGIKLGLPFLQKYGPKIHINEQKINRAKKLFNKIGPILLLIGYFIPGIRHVTAYLAGINSYSFKKFALFAYSGAIIWGFFFITLGRILGKNWHMVEHYVSKFSMVLIPIILLGLIVTFYIVWKRKKDAKDTEVYE
ncbi:DedA family protein [Bacillus sp. S/N-304-OC-R1]|uniref:DedA family protein n=1 Tax=Bacillus sp. S/N-304-OC-R1 TaxID=2758034 RepID=UPI001C8D32B6|nr:DedA family protein [Bacillus sp. S/N-304-OC-R1]MBY0124079.1 DedA family protein [Bacillus sp. S/N-304-OC-R1]